MIDSLVEVGVLRPEDSEVPDEHIVFQWLGEQVFWSLLHHGLHLLENAVLADRLTHTV